ncbi:uncharacterized protein VICG_02203, partial [Vittaforma corneae ATCC 50505]
FRAVGAGVGGDPVIFHFGSSSPIVEDLTERYGIYLGNYLPKALYTMFCPIFFSGIIFNMFVIIPILQKWFSLKGRTPSRAVVTLALCVFLFATAIVPISGLGSVISIIGFLLTTPLSFMYPALFVLFTPSRSGTMKIGSGIVVGLSIAIMVGLTAMKIVDLSSLKVSPEQVVFNGNSTIANTTST